MFTKPLVFVLGAGISAPFGFPVGKGLKNAICRPTNVSAEVLADLLANSLSDFTHGFFTAGSAYFWTVHVKKFLSTFNASDMYSIDAWLEANRSNANLMKVGKHAIAAIIMNAETEAITEGADVSADWFAWLWNNMLTAEIEDLKKNNVKFITFNYDRLFEWKLKQQIENTYLGATPEQHLEAFNTLRERIVHVHGVMGCRNDPDPLYGYGACKLAGMNNGISTESDTNKQSYALCMNEFAASLHIVHETQADTALLDKAKTFLDSDARVIFLGFSFDKRNVKKLGLIEYAQKKRFIGPTLDHEENRLDHYPFIGTGMGLKKGEKAAARTLLMSKLALASDNMDAVEFCRTYIQPDPQE